MSSAVLQGGRSPDIHEFCFQAAYRSHMVCIEQQWGLFVDCQELYFRSPNGQIIEIPSC